MTVMDRAQQVFEAWQEEHGLAEAILPLVGRLYRERGVITLLYGRPLMHQSPTQLLEEHRYVRQVEENDFSIRDTFPLLDAMGQLALTPARVDLGKLAMRWRAGARPDVAAFLKAELGDSLHGKRTLIDRPRDVILYGFGRIGRLVARLLMERAGNGEGMRLRAVVVRQGKAADDLEKRASLLQRDSVHGPFKGIVEVDRHENAIIANGNLIRVLYADGPEQLDYTSHGIEDALICDNTGAWRDEAGLSRHLEAKGAGKVLLTAPGKGALKNVVCGVNDGDIGEGDRIVSAASCTTNAIVPVLKVLHDGFGIESGHIETVHSFTNDQNLIDNYHPAERRGRSAALNMVLTSTGAAKAAAKALPALAGKLTGNAIRVPTPNVSMAVLNLRFDKDVTKDAINAHLKWASVHSPLHKQIDYSASDEIASTDVIGSRFAGVVDSQATLAEDRRAVVYVWYDNEYGYSVQVVRVLQRLAGIEYPLFPVEA